MKKILTISPISIAGALIINGLSKGFEQLGYKTLNFDVRKLDFEAIKIFKPDFAIGYDYAHFVDNNAEKIIKELNIPIVHYFADDPNANFAHSGNLDLIKKLEDSGNTVFCWDKALLNSFKKPAHYLPLGVDPDLYTLEEKPEIIHDITFVGRPLTETRLNILSEIVKNFGEKLVIYSFEKHFLTSINEMQRLNLLNPEQLEIYKNCYRGFLETEKDMAKVYSGSKINLNITMDQGVSSMNYRVLEVLASGGFLLTDYKQDTAEYFEQDKNLVYYKDSSQLIENISKYLKNNDLRDQITENGNKKVLKHHTFRQRAEEILRIINRD